MNSVEITAPLYVDLPRKRGHKRYYLSMNNYRNWKGFESNQVKQTFKELIYPLLEGVGSLKTPVKATFTFYAPDKRRRDLSNFCSVVEKFMDDVMTAWGVIPDDDTRYLKEVTYKFGGIDPGNGRVECKYEEM